MISEGFRYDLMVEDALRGVVRGALSQCARDGLHGNHRFYITFRTDFPGVVMSDHLRAKYPRDITIVLEHKFWDLKVTRNGFSVTLSFSKMPEDLFVPLTAVVSFADPSVNFVLQFNVETSEKAAGTVAVGDETAEARRFEAAPLEPGNGETTPDDIPEERTAGAGHAARTGEVVALDSFRKK